ncbi:hypothetical protein Scep_002127 [Stephania cephalantha]|uniref:Uncharacterized protein n=1 Tax=Stephania cephalantha TaxID=152367 RepID=A0AAP0L9P9_9MAGN
MFVPRPPSVNLPPYYFDPYAPGPSSSYVDPGMPHPQMYPSLPQYMPSPYTPTPYNYNMAYSGDPSFMNLLTMSQPHVPFPQPHAGSQYFGMVSPPIFGSISSRGESSQEPEETQQSTRRDSSQDQLPQQAQGCTNTSSNKTKSTSGLHHHEQQRQRNREINLHDEFT